VGRVEKEPFPNAWDRSLTTLGRFGSQTEKPLLDRFVAVNIMHNVVYRDLNWIGKKS
jgi:hypothetical protein